ncbi:MAG TPA: carboxypeptidase regulatory-like domain-containing protein, partial [Armatimonadota bacterium]|nr:carboxypeptidase regulatory-like domain-containing protein [Armatimonadota bacterium]
MNDPDPTKTPLHVYALRALVPTGVLVVAAMVAAQSGDDGSVLPGAPPTAPAAPTAPVRGTADGRKTPPARPHRRASLEIVALRAGPGPYPWGRGGRIARSFITDTPEVLEVVAQARFKSEPALLSGVRWEVTPPTGFTVPADATLEGAKLIVRLRRAEGNPSGGGEPLALAVTATLASGGTTHRETATLQQDLRDRLRQEYVDLERAYVPSRNALLDEMEFRKRYGRKYRSVQFAELNKTKQPGRAEQYPYILAEEALVGALHRAEREYGRPLNITSGFRNPVRQVEVHASVGESHHQYGRAADLYVPPDSVHPGTRQRIASELDWFRLASAALRGGGVWIEPMLACHVNTDGCHVHVDVRERGTPSRVVRVRGRVTDPSGNPIAGATVRLAGMPAITSASGAYSLKHVLTPRQYELQVEAPGRGATTQAVAVGGGETQVSVRLQADPQPTLVARADPARAGAGPLTVR